MSPGSRDRSPEIDPEALRELAEVLGEDGVRVSAGHRLVYSTDAMPVAPRAPAAVLYPTAPEEVVETVRRLHRRKIPFVPRGAGTGLSGGAVPLDGAVVLSLARMRRIHHLDPVRRLAVVEPGVVNAALSRAAFPFGLEFAPDPSSQFACTIGGNVAENSGGPHTLKHGVTGAHLLALEAVLPDGTSVLFPPAGDRMEDLLPHPHRELPGLDGLSLLAGSEGTLAVVTRIAARLTPIPAARTALAGFFPDGEDAVAAVTDLIASGFLPAAVEMIDEVVLDTVSRAFDLPVPAGARAFLLAEVDGLPEAVEVEAGHVERIFRERGAVEIRRARTEEERERLWAARKKAFGALGRLSPGYYVHDGVVPRTRLAGVLAGIREASRRRGLTTANIFHAGDGNLHPTILFDPKDAGQAERAKVLGNEILGLCLDAGGTLTGEHGIGWEKRHLMERLFTPEQMDLMGRLRDLFNPDGLLNPGKVLPFPSGCFEGGRGLRPGAAAWASEPAGAEASGRFSGARPETQGQLTDALRAAAASGRTVIPRGGGTYLDRSGRSGADDLLIETRGLGGIRRVSPGDLTIEAGAGTTLEEIDEALARHGLWVPLDARDRRRSTVGGLLASAHAGHRAGHWGACRFRVLALEVESPALGRQLWGRGVTKNVAGYDVARMMVGGFGALGIITAAVLRADPRPQARATALLTGDRTDLERLAGDLFASHLPWSHVELLGGASMGAPRPGATEGGPVLLAGCDGSAEVSLRLRKEMDGLIGGLRVDLAWVSTDDVEDRMWGHMREGEGIILRCHVDPVEAPSLFGRILGSGTIRAQLHVPLGILRIGCGDEPGARSRLFRSLRSVLPPRTPVFAEADPGQEPARTEPSGRGGRISSLMADLARLFDPTGLIRGTVPGRLHLANGEDGS